MSRPTGWLLVLSTVHQADDPRLRDRTVGVLSEHTRVRYAAKPPAPRPGDFEWVPLAGGRLRRWLAGAREALRRDVAGVSLHDPELVPLGLAVRRLRGVPVVLDMHEDVPGQLRTKAWLPRPLRLPLALLAAAVLRLAERSLTITLAEAGYRSRFRRDHPVFPNYPLADSLPPPRADAGYVVYVGDVTEARGAVLAVRAVARLPDRPPLRLVGRCAPDLRARLERLAAELGVTVDLPGFVPHADAMRLAAGATVGISPLADVPNYRHSLPTKVIEYLAVGVPVVASDLPGTAEAVGGLPGVTLVAPGDEQAWSSAIARVLADPRVREAAAANADEVRARFTWPAQDLWEVYGGVLAGRSCP